MQNALAFYFQRSMTARPVICPCSSFSNIFGKSSNRYNSTGTFTLPCATKFNASTASWRLPTREDLMVMQRITVENKSTLISWGGMAIKTTVPRVRTYFNEASIAGPEVAT